MNFLKHLLVFCARNARIEHRKILPPTPSMLTCREKEIFSIGGPKNFNKQSIEHEISFWIIEQGNF